ncbi:MAG TPA: PAS domain S-box protein [Paludibacter sp.]
MNLKFKTKPALISTVIILTLLLSWLVGSVTEQEMRNAFMLQTQIGANAIDVNHVKNLTGTLADLKSPDYLQLKQQFASNMKVDKDQRFIYLMGINKNNKIFFYVDDRPDGHPEGSPPGSTYDEAAKEFVNVMQTGIPTIVGPYSDRWGSFASGCAPVIDPETGKTIAIFAIDFATSSWYWKIILHSALPIALVILLILALLTTLASRQRGILLKISEEKYRFMFDNNPQPNWIYDIETLAFLEVNEAAIIHYGYSKKEFLSMTLKDIRLAEDVPSLLEDVNRTRNSFNNSGEWRHIKKNGELIFVEIISHTMLFNDREARHVLAHYITDRKLAEEALKRANTELENLHNNLNEAVFSVDVIQNKMIYASLAHQTVFGHSPAEFFENPQLWYEIILPEDKPIVDAGYPVLFSGKNLTHEYRIAHPNGVIHWIEAKMSPTLDDNGKLTRLDGIAYDITHRKQIETELLESEINFRRSISESPVGIRIVSVDGDTVYANKAFLDTYEFNSLEEFKNTPAINRYLSESYVQHQVRKKKRKDGVEVFDYEISIIGKNEEIRHIKVSRKEVLWNGIKHFQVINLNITEQRNAEKDIVKLAKAIVTSGEAIFLTDCEGVFTFINPAFTSLYGFTADEIIGKSTPRIIKSAIFDMSVYENFWQTLLKGDEVRGELINKRKDGKLIEIESSSTPIIDEENKIIGFLGIQRDITERKRAEIELSNSKEQLRKFASHLQNVREEEKVALAREIHDDLGQILVALKIDMGLLKKDAIKKKTFSGSEDTLDKFDNIVTLIDKTIKTARRIMNGLRPEFLELNGFVEATKEYLREFEERHHIICEYACEISNLEMNPQQSLAFFRILQEAMNNIAKHSKAELVKIQLQNLDNKLCLEIIDNGVGFDKNNNGRDDSYGMIGMKERVILLDGELYISSEVGQGTTVRVEMPYNCKQL